MTRTVLAAILGDLEKNVGHDGACLQFTLRSTSVASGQWAFVNDKDELIVVFPEGRKVRVYFPLSEVVSVAAFS